MNVFGNESKEEVSNLEKQMGRKMTLTAGEQVHRSAHCTVLLVILKIHSPAEFISNSKSSTPERAHHGLQDY